MSYWRVEIHPKRVPMEKYPTDEQIEEMFTAWKNDGKTGIAEVLRMRRRERKESEAKCKDSLERGSALSDRKFGYLNPP
jgi:hypothetical protein